jgi:transposase IS116/IS110/IS902 family protein
MANIIEHGDPSRFNTANQMASYIGMIPCEHSSGKRQRLGKADQGRQLAAALSVDRSDAACGRERPGAETLLSAQAHSERNGQSQDRSGPQTGDPAVDYDARSD